MKTIDTHGITYIEPVPEGTSEWYYGISKEYGDLYEAEETFRRGRSIKGNSLCLIHFPDGEVFWPFPKTIGICTGKPVYLNYHIYFPNVDFVNRMICIFCFDCQDHETKLQIRLPLKSVRSCFNLQLHGSPLSLTRQGEEGLFEIIWPERISFKMDPHESFFLRADDRLYFWKWYEEGDGSDYRYWEETVVRSMEGKVLEILPGDVRIMPDGEMWHLK